MKDLSQAWTVASAALPNGWRIVGIVHADLYGELAKLPAYLELEDLEIPEDLADHLARLAGREESR